MPDSKRATYHHGDLRSALIDAAEAELRARGLAGFSLRRVAARVGVSHSASSHHFGDAQGLLDALGVLAFDRLLKAMQDRSVSSEGPVQKVVDSGFAYIDFARANPALYDLIFGSRLITEPSSTLNAAGDAAFGHLAAAIASDRARAADVATLPNTVDHQEQAYTIWTITHGFAQMVLSGRLAPYMGAGNDVVERMYARTVEKVLQ